MEIPTKFKEAKVKDLEVNLQDLIKKSITNNKGLCLSGASGVGKTYALYAIYRLLKKLYPKKIIEPCEEFPKGKVISEIGIDFYDAGDLMYRLKDYKHEYCEFGGPSLLNQIIQDRNILFIDDLGVEKSSPTDIEHLTMILNSRDKWDLQTFISTNLSPEEMSKQFGSRIYSRISGLCEIVPCEGEDRRL